MPHEEIQLVVEAIEADYNQAVVALHGVSFTVRRGEIRALLGSNGAGKSTTLKAVANLLPAERGRVTAGAIRFEGHNVRATSTGDLVRLGLVQVLEGRHVFRSLTVEDNLVTGAIGRGSGRADIARDLDRVYGWFPRLAEKRRAPAGLTSGGEQQMLAIGRALMARPRLIVLDEPSMGLAPLVVRDIFRTLKQLNTQEQLSILVAEQNSTVALTYADTATVLENGVVVLEGTAAELRNREDIKAFYLGEGAPHAV
ncbi:ABC transporter ATP-binding protein [Xanthobacter autotrophicus DSM 431]|uniref:ABC transporter ATP-binding protein n=1 Tax=Xanthobacter nonsaccharivorans TaxID=3119912 RepID=UPI00372C3E66